MITVTENFRKIQDLLTETIREAGRPAGSVQLVAVSKTHPAAAVREAVAAGQRHFGENFVQEGLAKMQEVGGNDLVWHFIGHLQSNKTRAVAEHFRWVHTVDRLKTARRLSEQRPYYAGDLNVCIQVNIDEEAGKSGIAPDRVLGLAGSLATLPRLRLRGLMCIPALREGFDAQRDPFRRLRLLAESLAAAGLAIDTLSMGMTADFRAAIYEGSTMVRLGTALFGART